MISAYELAILSNAIYEKNFESHISHLRFRIINKPFEISGLRIINVARGPENVIIFRGTDTRNGVHSVINFIQNIGTDLIHLNSRNSIYIRNSKAFIGGKLKHNTILTGHSLGGFLAISMAFHKRLKVVAFNPPWITLSENAEITNTFKKSRLKVYHTTDKIVTNITRIGRIEYNNCEYISRGNGGHGIEEFINILDNNIDRKPLKWN